MNSKKVKNCTVPVILLFSFLCRLIIYIYIYIYQLITHTCYSVEGYIRNSIYIYGRAFTELPWPSFLFFNRVRGLEIQLRERRNRGESKRESVN
ncbi:hypothetical protein HanXRQr2_Chr16g0737001 [Helianthus annuus]|uniref:Uncharacterized protein n=1 Tax=Helianthus annuus TaxID=4232 RepID=A0A251U623_HELAN|nr:hypothetical protein HanXRQr2_Chr16g0737001 [Helianthus annuus]